MTALWTAADAARATGGRATTDWQATGVSIDTRTIRPGDLFVALTDVRDGHDFVADALAKGAAAALVSRIPEGVADTAPLLLVDDVLPALERLGAAGRARTGARVIAITGSAGKTSTKEMLRHVLSAQGRTHAAEASYNNHWGVPLTLARMPADTDFAVIEIGMNAPGEIAPLSRLARPHVALVTTVVAAHLAAFGSLDGIAREKASIFEGLDPSGTAIVNADVETRAILADIATAHAARVIRFGEAEDADYRLHSAELRPEATVIQATRAGDPVLFKIATSGRHFASNALAVLAAVDAVGADSAVAATDLGRWSPPAGRGTRERVSLDAVNEAAAIDLIDDAFNANPASISAALDVLAATADGTGRRIAILGDMLELGPTEDALHRAIADHPAMASIDLVHCVGPRMAWLWDTLPPARRGEKAETAETLAARAHDLIDPGDTVLVKGSKGSRVSLVVDAIRKLGARRPLGV